MVKQVSLGVIITNRDRVEPMERCFQWLEKQRFRPSWIILSDLGSSAKNAKRLKALCSRYGATYLRIEHSGPWIKGLAFNTALKRSPPASHVINLDADIILHPDTLQRMATELRTHGAVVVIPGELRPPFRSMVDAVRRSRMRDEWSLGGCVAYPKDWLLETRGIDEEFVGWGNQDVEIWDRAQQAMSVLKIQKRGYAFHLSHTPQISFYDQKNKQKNLVRRVEHWKKRVRTANPKGFGEGKVVSGP